MHWIFSYLGLARRDQRGRGEMLDWLVGLWLPAGDGWFWLAGRWLTAEWGKTYKERRKLVNIKRNKTDRKHWFCFIFIINNKCTKFKRFSYLARRDHHQRGRKMHLTVWLAGGLWLKAGFGLTAGGWRLVTEGWLVTMVGFGWLMADGWVGKTYKGKKKTSNFWKK